MVFPHCQAILGPQVGRGGVVPGVGWRAQARGGSVGLARSSGLIGAASRHCRDLCREVACALCFSKKAWLFCEEESVGAGGRAGHQPLGWARDVRMGEGRSDWSRDGGEGRD